MVGNKQYQHSSVINGSGHTRKQPQHVNRTTIVRTHSICSSDRAAHGTYSTSYEYNNRTLYLCAWDVLRSPGSHCFTSPICLSFRVTATQNQIDLNRIGIDRQSTAQIRNCRFRSIVSMICLCCCAANKFLRLDAHLICVLWCAVPFMCVCNCYIVIKTIELNRNESDPHILHLIQWKVAKRV